MKRFISIILCIVLALSIFSCSKIEESAETTSAPKKKKAETTSVEEPNEPALINPLTGEETSKDLSGVRPVSIMVNNIYQSLPQEGVASADILFECLAEGGITRLMMICADIDAVPKVGSVRSARDYYIDYAQGYGCLFVHAGGSTYAYNTISKRGVNNIDGVNGPAAFFNTTGTFVRDSERLKKFSYEHTLMVVSGEGIKKAAEYKGYSLAKEDKHKEPMVFCEWGGSTLLSESATHAKVVMSTYQTVDFVYSKESGEYLRYQYDGDKHMDSASNTQLSFKNVLLLYTDCGGIAGDEKDRIWMTTTGEGSGYYLTEGTYKKIKWKKAAYDEPLKYYFEDGTEVQFNRGKTMINVVPSYNSTKTVFVNEWK